MFAAASEGLVCTFGFVVQSVDRERLEARRGSACDLIYWYGLRILQYFHCGTNIQQQAVQCFFFHTGVFGMLTHRERTPYRAETKR